MPISYLSAGYQSMLWMTMDIAFRLLQLNPGITSMDDVSGIIMIDEIDMHLHPKWQWRILNVLHKVFPAVQFIITTHAPIVISSCKDGHLIRIDENHEVTYPKSAYGYAIDDVATLCQGSSGIPADLNMLRKKFDDAISNGKKDEAQAVYAKLCAEFGSDNTEAIRAHMLLSL